jgi:hypothetical protein
MMARSSTEDAEPTTVERASKTSTTAEAASPDLERPDATGSRHAEDSVDNAAPLLPDEQPPLPDEQSPVPDEQPPLPDEQPPLPDEQPPLPAETAPAEAADDGWQPMWDERAQAYYFFNRFTNVSQWENPRVPEATTTANAQETKPHAGGYNPAIHGDYDPNADYAQAGQATAEATTEQTPGIDPAAAYAATGAFNRFTGKWQAADFTPDRFSDESKSKRQMSAFFDVDAAANTHDGRSLKAERANKKISKKELQAFKEKRRDKKEEKRRAWLRD